MSGRHLDAKVPEREQLACLLWKCDYRAMNLLSGGDGFGDGSVTWNTLQPIERMRWIGAAEAFEDSAWLADRLAAARAEGAGNARAEMRERVAEHVYLTLMQETRDHWTEWRFLDSAVKAGYLRDADAALAGGERDE